MWSILTRVNQGPFGVLFLCKLINS
jgi:hypothetical protein